MIDRTHDLPLARQAALLRLSRSSLYYEPQSVPEAELAIMRRIDALHLGYPFAGSRMLRDLLRGEGVDPHPQHRHLNRHHFSSGPVGDYGTDQRHAGGLRLQISPKR